MRREAGRGLLRVAGLILGLASAGLSGPVVGQEAAPPMAVLTLDQNRFFAESAFGRAVLAREAADTSALAAENLQIEQTLEAEERDLTTRRANLPAAEFTLLATEFDTRVEEIRTAQDAKSRAIGQRREDDRQRFLQAAVPVLGELLTEAGAAIIVDKATVILALSSLDVTDEAIAKVDAALGDGSAPPEPEPAATP